MTDYTALVEDLKAGVRSHGLDDDYADVFDIEAADETMTKAADHIARQDRQIATLWEALKPFAEAADNMDGDEPDNWSLWESPEATILTYADLRKARAIVKDQT